MSQENVSVEMNEVVAPVAAPAIFTQIRNVKTNFDVTQFKKTGVVVATYQISAGSDVRYTFRAPTGVMGEDGTLTFPEALSVESFTDCAVYIPSLKKSVEIGSDTIFHEVMAKAFFDSFKDAFALEVKAKKESESVKSGKGN